MNRAGRWLLAMVASGAFCAFLGWVYLVAGPWLRGER